ncbi:hypothetical protein LINGRAPRIM_LOCUS2682 [Linum grandiflorum]
MLDLGVAHRRRVRANVFSDAIEVEQLNKSRCGWKNHLRKYIYYWVNEYYTLNYAEKAYGFGGIPALPGHHAWEAAVGNVIQPPRKPKKNRRKKAQKLETRPSKHRNGGTSVTRKGILMHCSKCKQEGHNTRRCTWAGAGGTGDNGDDDDHGVAGDNGGIEGIDGNGGAASGNDGNVGRGWRTRRTRCGYCSELGHNSRRQMLIQTPVVEFKRGKGEPLCPVTGNTYFRVGTSNARRTDADEEVVRASQQPPLEPNQVSEEMEV